MAAMFSNARSTTSSSGHIVEFKAGRSRLDAGSADTMRKVVAEPTKGLVYIKQSNDMLIHFCWKNRETGALVDDLIIFPDDAEFKAVTGCPDGKVYMLKFRSSGEMKLFWLQDSTPDVDKDLVRKVNDALNKPPTSRPSASRSSGSTTNADRPSAGGSSIMSGNDFNAPLGGLDQGQLMSLIQSLQGNSSDSLPLTAGSGAAPSSEADCEPTAGEGSSNPLSLDNPAIQNIFKNLGQQQKRQGGVSASLGEALANSTVADVAKNHADELAQHLPASDDPAKELADTVRTPQFRQAADTLGHALQTGQLGPVLSQFGMNDETIAAATQGDLRKFATNLTKAEGGEQDKSAEARVDNPICRRAVPSSVLGQPCLGFFSRSIAATVSRLENPEDDVAREPEAKRNRPDNEDMDVD
ncbi:hypothetical protein L5515_003450 [Caenorhabditis briggsae]|uniref:Proteasomal ubiquitin receptor ADRM1 homolog n=1 Tax=Caenorhabditis briggsae TaxID=6238 RepID=A0AAE9EHS7_CAEBR|nr:hypothetical protein L5515_003450 [Caenorhabditis briggsae]